MTFNQLLEQIEELEIMIQEANKKTREKYYVKLDILNKELEEKIRKQKY